MTGQNDRQDESLTGQVHDQAGHCPLTGRYFEPWKVVLKTGHLIHVTISSNFRACLSWLLGVQGGDEKSWSAS